MIVVRSHLGRRSRIASPSPRRVTRPTRALASCRMMQPPTAKVTAHSSPKPNCAPAAAQVEIVPGPTKAAAIARPGP